MQFESHLSYQAVVIQPAPAAPRQRIGLTLSRPYQDI